MGQIVIQHGRTGSHPQRNAPGNLRRHAGTDRTSCPHKYIYIRRQPREQQIQPLQSRCRPHKIPMIKCEHHRIAAFGVKNIGQMLLHSPVQTVCTFHIIPFLIGKRYIHMVIFCYLQSIFVCHIHPFLSSDNQYYTLPGCPCQSGCLLTNSAFRGKLFITHSILNLKGGVLWQNNI